MASTAKGVRFVDGENLDAADLNRITTADRFASGDLTIAARTVQYNTEAQWISLLGPSNLAASSRVYSLGGGSGTLRMSATSDVTVMPGVVAISTTDDTLDADAPNIATVPIRSGDVGTILTIASNAGGGSDRFDLIVATPAVVSGNSVSRDFKDAVTGVLTTGSVDKDAQVVLTFSVVQGVVGGGIPATPAGTKLFGYIRTDAASTQVDEYFDEVYPIGCCGFSGYDGTGLTIAGGSYVSSASPTAGPSYGTGTSGDSAYCMVPVGGNGGPSRILEVSLVGVFDTATTVDIVQLGDATATSVQSVAFTPSASLQTLVITPSAPLWSTGLPRAAPDTAEFAASSCSTVAVRVTSGSAITTIRRACWKISS